MNLGFVPVCLHFYGDSSFQALLYILFLGTRCVLHYLFLFEAFPSFGNDLI